MGKLLIKIITIVTIILFILPQKVLAEEPKFSTRLDITYEVSEEGETTVKSEGKITNLTSNFLVSKYFLTVSNLDIYDVYAKDGQGDLKTETVRDGENAKIELVFNEKVVGKNKSLEFYLEYKTLITAKKNGLVWDITIPRMDTSNETLNYATTLIIPESVGPMMFSSPKPVSSNLSEGKIVYFFGENTLDSGLSAAFGKYQLMNFDLNYNLNNTSPFPKKQEVAIPSDIRSRQEILIKSIFPKPVNVTIDLDGNYITEFLLKPFEKKEVKVTGQAKIYNREVNTALSGKISKIPKNFSYLTKENLYWEVTDPEIQKIATDITRAEKTVAEKALAIYTYVANELKYGSERLAKNDFERYGAKNALSNKSAAMCMEYSDLFITLSRAAGIPAREIDGFALTQSKSLMPTNENEKLDILHSWAEFYDPNLGWVQIDPTWASTSGLDFFTKLDTNHLAFVRRGASPDEPLIPGSHIEGDTHQKVFVSFSDTEVEKEQTYLILKDSRFLNRKNLKIINPNSSTYFSLKINNKLVGDLPPFSSLSINKNGFQEFQVKYEDFEGRVKTEKATAIIQEKGDYLVPGIIFLIVFGASFLFLTLLIAKARAKSLRKQFDRPSLHLPDQDR